MKILLHTCCGNCAIVPVKTLREEGHRLAGFWFNPNIQPYKEYELRLNSLKDLSERWRFDMIYASEYNPDEYFKMLTPRHSFDNFSTTPFAKGPACPADRSEGGFSDANYIMQTEKSQFPQRPKRCNSCYTLRLEKTAHEAVKNGFDAFTTTLLISPYQDFEQITAIGSAIAEKYNVLFFLRDFRPQFKRSMTIAKELGLYKQKYCGCIFSKAEREELKDKKAKIKIVEQKIH